MQRSAWCQPPNSCLPFRSHHTFHPPPHAHSVLNQLRLKAAHPPFSRWAIYSCGHLCVAGKGGLPPAGLDAGLVCHHGLGLYKWFTPATLSSRAAGVLSPGPGVCCPPTGKSSSAYGSYLILLKCWLCSKLWQKRFVFLCVYQSVNWLAFHDSWLNISISETVSCFSQGHLITVLFSQLLILLYYFIILY